MGSLCGMFRGGEHFWAVVREGPRRVRPGR